MEITRSDRRKATQPDALVPGRTTVPAIEPGQGKSEADEASRRRRGTSRRLKDVLARRSLFVTAVLLIALLILIAVVLVRDALPILRDYSVADLLSQEWHPTQGAFGLLPFIAGSFVVTLLAMVLGVGGPFAATATCLATVAVAAGAGLAMALLIERVTERRSTASRIPEERDGQAA